MFERLFAESGLSLERLRALVAVGAAGSIVRAADSDPVRQSQYSRQIKELEDFFQAGLVERHGKGIRLTATGRELARISRFFMMGLSNFQRGCLAEGQSYRLGGPPTFARVFLAQVLAAERRSDSTLHFALESVGEDELERRLHDLTLDYAVTTRVALSRPLQVRELGLWRVMLWVPRSLCKTPSQARRDLSSGRLPFAWPAGELPLEAFPELRHCEPAITCRDFLECRSFLDGGGLAAFLPDFIAPESAGTRIFRLDLAWLEERVFRYGLAWNPRLLRLNPHSRRQLDRFAGALIRRLAAG